VRPTPTQYLYRFANFLMAGFGPRRRRPRAAVASGGWGPAVFPLVVAARKLRSVPLRGSYQSKSRRDADEAWWLSLTDAVEKGRFLLGVSVLVARMGLGPTLMRMGGDLGRTMDAGDFRRTMGAAYLVASQGCGARAFCLVPNQRGRVHSPRSNLRDEAFSRDQDPFQTCGAMGTSRRVAFGVTPA
jgi:hypothetical protein